MWARQMGGWAASRARSRLVKVVLKNSLISCRPGAGLQQCWWQPRNASRQVRLLSVEACVYGSSVEDRPHPNHGGKSRIHSDVRLGFELSQALVGIIVV